MKRPEFSEPVRKSIASLVKEGAFPKNELAYVQAHLSRWESAISRISKTQPPHSILDVGTSPLTLALGRIFPTSRITTLDLETKWHESAENAGVDFVVCDLTRSHLPFRRDSFQVILFLEVLEHLACNPNNVLGNFNDAIVPDGALIVQTPNLLRFANRWRLFFGRNPFGATSETGHVLHWREYTISECERFMRESGFVIMDSRYARFHEETIENHLLRTALSQICRLRPDLSSGIEIVARKPSLGETHLDL